MAKRISSKNVGTKFDLNFNNKYTMEGVELLKVWSDEHGERATFKENGFEWEAYRYQGRWSYGSGAERLTVLN